MINESDTIVAKNVFKNKRSNRFRIIEVNANLRKLFLKRRDKIEWIICPAMDHFTIGLRYYCNKFGNSLWSCNASRNIHLKSVSPEKPNIYAFANKQLATNLAALYLTCSYFLHKINIKKNNISYRL